MPKLSVIMPVFNQEAYISAAIESILKQTYSNFEFIIVDDGSTDRTIEIIQGFDDPRIRLIRNEHTGFITTLVMGYQEAKGEWIARMDSDDLCRPDRLERQMTFLENQDECAFVGTAYGFVTPNGYCAVPPTRFTWRYISSADITLGGRVFGDPTVVFRRELAERVGFHDPEFNNENPLWYRLLHESKGAVLGEPLYLARWLLGSLSRDPSHEFVGAVGKSTAFLNIREKYDPENAVKLKSGTTYCVDKALTGKLKMGLVIYLAAGDRLAAIRLTWDGWKVKPFSLVRIKLLVYALLGITGIRTGNDRKSTSSLLRCPSPLILNNKLGAA